MYDFTHVMKMYNLLYCNKTQRAYTDRVGELLLCPESYVARITVDNFANKIIDASLECCGHTFYSGAVAHLFEKITMLGDDMLEGLAEAHLLNFATEEHIETLKKGVK